MMKTPFGNTIIIPCIVPAPDGFFVDLWNDDKNQTNSPPTTINSTQQGNGQSANQTEDQVLTPTVPKEGADSSFQTTDADRKNAASNPEETYVNG